MLCLTLSPGEYVTLGEQIVLQFDRTTGEKCKVLIDAPREIPVVRGKVRERGGGERPASVYQKPRWRRPEILWDRSKAQALAAMRGLLSEMDGRDPNVQTLRRQINHIFPPIQKG